MKKFIALGLSVLLITSMSVSGFAATTWTPAGTPIEGESTVKNPVIEYIVPTDVNFSIDPFMVMPNAKKSQIYSQEYTVDNLGNSAIKVELDAKVTTGDTYIKSKEAINEDDPDNTDKEAYIELVPSPEVNVKDQVKSANLTTPGSYVLVDSAFEDFNDNAFVAPLKGTSNTIIFGLGASSVKEYDDSGTPKFQFDYLGNTTGVTATEKTTSIASFRLMGKVNPNANWVANDIKVTVTFKVTGLTTVMLDGLRDSNNAIKAASNPGGLCSISDMSTPAPANVPASVASVNAGGASQTHTSVGGVEVYTITGTATGNFVINFNYGSGTGEANGISSILYGTSSTTCTTALGATMYNSLARTFTLPATAINGLTTSGNFYKVNFAGKNGNPNTSIIIQLKK